MRTLLKILLLSVILLASYIGSYAVWRGSAGKEQCDHPYIVELPRGYLSEYFYYPAIMADRFLNGPSTEIHVTGGFY
jgi:hypothetical protein